MSQKNKQDAGEAATDMLSQRKGKKNNDRAATHRRNGVRPEKITKNRKTKEKGKITLSPATYGGPAVISWYVLQPQTKQ